MWIARDKDGSLWLHSKRPNKIGKIWLSNGEFEELQIGDNWFPEVKWSDKEPRELVLKPIK